MTTQTALELAERLAAPRQRHVFRVYAEEAAAMLRSQAAEIERLRLDAERWKWWCDAVGNQDLDLLEDAFKSIPHDKPVKKQDFDNVVDAARAALKSTK